MKNRRKMFGFLKLILFIFFISLLYFKLNATQWSNFPLVKNGFFLLLAISLVPINWLFEYLKWRETIDYSCIQLRGKEKIQSFFAGIVTGMLTPNMLGNFIGRLYYIPWKKRVEIIVLTMFSNYSQFLASLIFGTIAICLQASVLPVFRNPITISCCVVASGCLLLVYFNWSTVLRGLIPKISSLQLFTNKEGQKSFNRSILFWSFSRHAIFTIQFMAVLMTFGITFSLINILLIWQTYLLVTMVPSPFLGKIGVRDSIAVWVFSYAGIDAYLVLFSSFIIWVMNLLLPTFVGLAVCKRKPKNG